MRYQTSCFLKTKTRFRMMSARLLWIWNLSHLKIWSSKSLYLEWEKISIFVFACHQLEMILDWDADNSHHLSTAARWIGSANGTKRLFTSYLQPSSKIFNYLTMTSENSSLKSAKWSTYQSNNALIASMMSWEEEYTQHRSHIWIWSVYIWISSRSNAKSTMQTRIVLPLESKSSKLQMFRLLNWRKNWQR